MTRSPAGERAQPLKLGPGNERRVLAGREWRRRLRGARAGVRRTAHAAVRAAHPSVIALAAQSVEEWLVARIDAIRRRHRVALRSRERDRRRHGYGQEPANAERSDYGKSR